MAHKIAVWIEQANGGNLHLLDVLLAPRFPQLSTSVAGASRRVDHLLDRAFAACRCSIAAKALEEAKKRLGRRGDAVERIVAGVTARQPTALAGASPAPRPARTPPRPACRYAPRS
jgi:hypothetical protein